MDEQFASAKDNQKYSNLLISLLYPGYLPNLNRRPICLVQTRHVMPDELRFSGVPDSNVPLVQAMAGRLALAVALSESELQDYFNYPFEEWIKRQPDEFLASTTFQRTERFIHFRGCHNWPKSDQLYLKPTLKGFSTAQCLPKIRCKALVTRRSRLMRDRKVPLSGRLADDTLIGGVNGSDCRLLGVEISNNESSSIS